MGKGNPESADATFARESDVFVADKLSVLNKKRAEQLSVHLVKMRTEKGYQKFEKVFAKLSIPHF